MILNKHNILIIEDDKAGRNLLKTYLGDIGYDCAIAENGKKGFELYLSYDFDLVLLDYVMPVMDGIECLQKIKSVEKKRKIPIIFLTASEKRENHEEFINQGADDILLKPYDESFLKIKIQSWLRIKENMDYLADREEELRLRDFQHEEDLTVSNSIIKNRTNLDTNRIKNIKLLEYPAEIMSGDVLISEVSPSGKQNILLGDFTGHGLPAAIGSILVSELFYSMTSKGFSILEIANEINKKLKLNLPVNRFMAGCLIEIDFEDNSLSIIQAGMPDIMVYNSDTKKIDTIKSEFVPFGILDNQKLNLHVTKIYVDINSKMFIYSDGLIEAKNALDETFGYERLENIIRKSSYGFTAYEKIVNSYSKFMKGYKNFDDVTFAEVLIDGNLVEKNQEKNINNKKRSTSEWKLNISIDHNIMREIDPVPSIVNQLIELQGVQVSREKLFLILTELYSNALEHGILELDSNLKNEANGFVKYYELREEKITNLNNANIDFMFSHTPTTNGGILSIKVHNSGSGFDYDEINYCLENNLEFKGRGVGLISSLSDNFYYSENGCLANVVLGWKEAA